MLTLLPLIPALVLLATLLAGVHQHGPLSWGRNLPRAFFGLPPRGPRLRLYLSLAPAAIVALVCGWVVVADGGPRSRQAILLAVSASTVPAAVGALGVWFCLAPRIALPMTPAYWKIPVSRMAATAATALLPPLCAALSTGYTHSPAGAIVFSSVATLVAVAAALVASNRRAPPEPSFEHRKRSSSWDVRAHDYAYGHASEVNIKSANTSHAAPAQAAKRPTKTRDCITVLREHRTDSMLSEASDNATMAEWSFSGTVHRESMHRESVLYGLEIPEDVEEEDEYEGSDLDNHRLSLISRESHNSRHSNSRPRTPPRATHRRTGSTPLATDYSLIASYSPNPFEPHPVGFQSLTTLKGCSGDTLALCGPKENMLQPRERDASGVSGRSDYTFATETSGPIRVQLHSFETEATVATSDANTSNMTNNTSTLLPAQLTRPTSPTPERMQSPPKLHTKATLPPRSPLRVPSKPKLPVEESPRRSSATLVARRRNPLSLTLDPIPGTPLASPLASPFVAVDEHPRHMWLIGVVCVVACYGLNIPLLVSRTPETLAAFTAALILPSPLLALAVFYPRNKLPRQPMSPTPMARASDSTFVNVDVDLESGLPRISYEASPRVDSRVHASPDYMVQLPDSLFPFPLKPAPAVDKDYPFHALKLGEALGTSSTGEPAKVVPAKPNGPRAPTSFGRAGEMLGRASDEGFAMQELQPKAATDDASKPVISAATPIVITPATPTTPTAPAFHATPTGPHPLVPDAQSLLARVRDGFVSMWSPATTTIITSSPPSPNSPKKSRPSKSPATKSTKSGKSGKSHKSDPSDGNGDASMSSVDLSRDGDFAELGLCQIQVATRGRRSPSASLYVSRKPGLSKADFGGEEVMREDSPKDKSAKGKSKGKRGRSVEDEGTVIKTPRKMTPISRPSGSIEMSFRPSLEAEQSTPRRRKHSKGQSTSLSSFENEHGIVGIGGMDFSRPSNAPTINYNFTSRVSVIDMSSGHVLESEAECDQSIHRRAAIAQEFLDEQSEWEELPRAGGLRSLTTPTYTRQRLARAAEGAGPVSRERSPRSDTLHPGSTNSCSRGSVASMATVDAVGVEEMERMLALDTPGRAKYLLTPNSREGSGSSEDSPAVVTSTPVTKATTSQPATPATPDTGVRSSLPPVPAYLASLPPNLPLPPAPFMHHPHPPPRTQEEHTPSSRPAPQSAPRQPAPLIPAHVRLPQPDAQIGPLGVDRFKYRPPGRAFESTDSLDAVQERSFEGDDAPARTLRRVRAHDISKASADSKRGAALADIGNRTRSSAGSTSANMSTISLSKIAAPKRKSSLGKRRSLSRDKENDVPAKRKSFNYTDPWEDSVNMRAARRRSGVSAGLDQI